MLSTIGVVSAVVGGQADAEAGGQAGVGVAAARVRQHEQGLASGVELAPPAADPAPMRAHLLVQVLADPAGHLIWTSPAFPGSVYDLTAARTHGIIDALTAADIPCWADQAYRGAGSPVRVPYRGKWHNLSPGQQAVNRSHVRIRTLGERTVSILKAWRLLRRLRCSTTRITDLNGAILVLHLNAA